MNRNNYFKPTGMAVAGPHQSYQLEGPGWNGYSGPSGPNYKNGFSGYAPVGGLGGVGPWMAGRIGDFGAKLGGAHPMTIGGLMSRFQMPTQMPTQLPPQRPNGFGRGLGMTGEDQAQTIGDWLRGFGQFSY